jgi:hypothetical protein
LKLLKPNEKAALLSDPESLARLETMIQPYVQPAGKTAEVVPLAETRHTGTA